MITQFRNNDVGDGQGALGDGPGFVEGDRSDLVRVNLGDTLLHAKEWESIQAPDVLMIPIGGKVAHNTMNEEEAVQAVKAIQPKLVIPCHYNCAGLFSKSLNPADVEWFKSEVEKTGAECIVLNTGQSFKV